MFLLLEDFFPDFVQGRRQIKGMLMVRGSETVLAHSLTEKCLEEFRPAVDV